MARLPLGAEFYFGVVAPCSKSLDQSSIAAVERSVTLVSENHSAKMFSLERRCLTYRAEAPSRNLFTTSSPELKTVLAL